MPSSTRSKLTPEKQPGLILREKKTSSKKPAFDAVIFDIDNVLVDTRRSYIEAIRWTVDIFLTTGKVPFFVKNKKSSDTHTLSPNDIAQFKLLGGFNDDWDCCYGLLTYLLKLPLQGHSTSDLRRAADFKKLAKDCRTRPLGVSGIIKKWGRNPYVTIEKISRIFQEVYLGNALFERLEKRPAAYWNKKGLIHKERLVFRKSVLKKLFDRGIALGITTGRSRFEAAFALKHFGIEEYFSAITTMDEIKPFEVEKKQPLRKPHPFSLIETAKKLGADKKFLYVGDLPDDTLTALRAKESINVSSVGFPALSLHPKETIAGMQKFKVDFILEQPSQLFRLAVQGKI